MTTLDCRGLTCPQPVMKTKELISKDKPKDIEVLVDNQASLENVSRFLTKNGYTVQSAETSPGSWKITAEGGNAQAVVEDAEYVACPTPLAKTKTLVLITTETLGRGDDTLGTGLMANFLATLPELGPQLWRIVLLNGGVKLAVHEGKALDSLKALVAQGVSLLVCGTCLGHYGLLDKKQVGETTNMLDIVTSLSLADKVIRP
ncbi:MAG: sulfurtransferase-like selenium metabolism protein YedF [Desulfovibrionaceae bacterium]|nr:sulfurtransferase-like selenium metabolism protein YedF [Desulfovibrionaceae bacterium]